MRLAQRFLNTPLALAPKWQSVVLDALQAEVDFDHLTNPKPIEKEKASWLNVTNGVAQIDISGVLVHKAAWWGWGETSYDAIATDFVEAIARDEVHSIALMVDSPGGEVSGMFDLADMMFEFRGIKPVWAILDDCAYSAAYALASSADRIVVPRTGGTGSVGVIALHADISEALQKAGIKITPVTFGARKADYQEFQPLGDEAHKRLQAAVNKTGEMFVDLVSRNRGMSAAAVRATEAGTFDGDEGITVGFADAVMSRDEALFELMRKK
jgi:signal peptide peptidase SppA